MDDQTLNRRAILGGIAAAGAAGTLGALTPRNAAAAESSGDLPDKGTSQAPTITDVKGKVVYITLEDEFGHIPCMVFGKVYEQYEHEFRSAFLVVQGTLTRREGTCNVVIRKVKPFSGLEKVPVSKDWR